MKNSLFSRSGFHTCVPTDVESDFIGASEWEDCACRQVLSLMARLENLGTAACPKTNPRPPALSFEMLINVILFALLDPASGLFSLDFRKQFYVYFSQHPYFYLLLCFISFCLSLLLCLLLLFVVPFLSSFFFPSCLSLCLYLSLSLSLSLFSCPVFSVCKFSYL